MYLQQKCGYRVKSLFTILTITTGVISVIVYSQYLTSSLDPRSSSPTRHIYLDPAIVKRVGVTGHGAHQQNQRNNGEKRKEYLPTKEEGDTFHYTHQAQKPSEFEDGDRKEPFKQDHPDHHQQLQQQEYEKENTSFAEVFATTADIPFVSVEEVSCSSLINGTKMVNVSNEDVSGRSLSSEEILNYTGNCKDFVKRRRYITKPVSLEEARFPLAFSIMMYKNPGRAERLLRAVYRPQNIYCLHVDNKSNQEVFKAMESLASCLPNVFMSSKRVSVEWGLYSVLEPEFVCMRDLWKHRTWKYFINLTGQEFPLKTNAEIVKILKIYNGANDVQGIPYDTLSWHNQVRLKETASGRPKPRFPYPVRFFKGATHVTLSRAFVDYLLHDKIAEELRAWSEDLTFPEEIVIPTLQHNPQLGGPGAYTGPWSAAWIYTARHKIWFNPYKPSKCYGGFVRTVCVFGVGDLPSLARSEKLVANKFFPELQPLAYDCLEELHFNRTREDLTGNRPFNASFYQSLHFVLHAVRNVSKHF